MESYKGEDFMKLNVEIEVLNLPEQLSDGFIVARPNNSNLWYYGCYQSEERAIEVAYMLGNGVVMKYE